MASILDSVDQRTQLVGENRLELLMFRLGAQQLFAINVFKVREVVKLPHLNKMPGSHHNISGVANIRGVSIPVINLRGAIGMRPMAIDQSPTSSSPSTTAPFRGSWWGRWPTSST